MGTVRARLAGRALSGGLALLGVLLVVPSLFSPTREMAVADREHGSLLSRQWEWSWGRVRVAGLEGVELRDQWNPFGLAVLVVLLVAGLAGVAVWLARRVTWGHVLGLVAVGLLTGRVLTTVTDRLGRSLGEVDQGAAGLTVRTEMTQAGSFETAAACVLVVALVLMGVAAARSRGESALPAVLAGTPAAGPAAARPPAGREGAAGLRPAGEHLTTAPVSFDDSGPAGASGGTDTPATAGKPGRTP
ncbi:hypothetical protein [Terracoccus sp. 273MFTsu3.1]|uniref:hypothetical protein n=1 Tax=Terracoccus sp. 273MFTsu3.1 TaxID=1172188 RepID=UPI000379E017|nr:hypothetical protein [Terracoccus sp. 273MFTsu3.1]